MLQILHQNDYKISSWSGGKTIQLAIYPETCDYADRDFLWRISSATVDLPESDFTALPDYQRYITPIAGEMTLCHDGGARTSVPVGTIHAFDGAADTHSWGCCTDFNLMLRKGRASGGMRRIAGSAGSEYAVEVPENHVALLYCVQGDVQIEGTDATFSAGDSLLTDAPVRLLLRADSVLMEATASR
ncbi:MAG: HutD family protein [Clostridia bacterium]|nr:HutD family protein [Clostridia bacterium]